MCPQATSWTPRSLGTKPTASVAQLAADQAWLARCVADRRRARSETGTLYTYRASLPDCAA